MPTPRPIQAVIKRVVPSSIGRSWEVFLQPYDDLWLTIHADEIGNFNEPKPGDIITVVPPHIIGIMRPKERTEYIKPREKP